MWLLFLAIMLGTLQIARAEPDSRESTNTDAAANDDPNGEDDALEDALDAYGDEDDEADADAQATSSDQPQRSDRATSPGDDAFDESTDELDDLNDAEQLLASEVGDGATEGAADFDAERELAAGSEAREEEWLEGPDAREASLRSRKSWLGRIDVGVTWRRAFVEVGPNRNEVFLVASWRL